MRGDEENCVESLYDKLVQQQQHEPLSDDDRLRLKHQAEHDRPHVIESIDSVRIGFCEENAATTTPPNVVYSQPIFDSSMTIFYSPQI